MKAYEVCDKTCWTDEHMIIFAENSGQARSYAKQAGDELYETEFTDIIALRRPSLDVFYTGKMEIDYSNKKVQKALKNLGWGY